MQMPLLNSSRTRSRRTPSVSARRLRRGAGAVAVVAALLALGTAPGWTAGNPLSGLTTAVGNLVGGNSTSSSTGSGGSPIGVLSGLLGGSSPSATPAYWVAGSAGGIGAYGGTPFEGSMSGTPLRAPVVGMAATPDGKGYWLVASDGGIFSFGDAVFYGSMGGQSLVRPIAGMAATPDGKGYWLVASDGGIFA